MDPESSAEVHLFRDLRSAFWMWEGLRVLYNLMLAALVLVTIRRFCEHFGLSFPEDERFWLRVGMMAVAANVAFCAGPLAEAYVYLLGLRHAGIRLAARLLLFVAGLGASALEATDATEFLLAKSFSITPQQVTEYHQAGP